MERFELIEKNPASERFRLDRKLHELGTKAVASRTLRSEARPFLEEMSDRCNEAVSFAVAADGGILCLDRVDSPHTVIAVRTTVGARFPARCSAIGTVVLAYLREDEVETDPLKRMV